MKNFLWGLFKIVLGFTIFFLISALVVYIVVYHYEQSLWVAFLVIGILLVIALIVHIVLRFLKRFRQKKFVEHIIAQDDLLAQKAKNEEFTRLSDLRNRWHDAINFLKKNRPSRFSSPIYRLPWYLIIGETNAGKSSSIANSGLHSVNSDAGPIPGMTSTRNCDWWFLDNAVVIDSAGKYAVPVDGKIDEIEWQEFLVQLAAYRRKEPINGIMVALPAEKILDKNETSLFTYASFISDRVNGLVKVLGARIPIYVLITKCDLIAGFHELSGVLTKDELHQAFGYTSNVETETHSVVVEKLVESAVNSIHSILLSKQIQDKGTSRNNLLVLIQNIRMMEARIKKFISCAFDNTTYHEKVILRGIYLSSALQSGTQTSLYGKNLVSETYEVSRSRSMFLKNVFREIMPHDRGLYQPILEFLKWKTLSSNLLLNLASLVSLCYIGYTAYGLKYSDDTADLLGDTIISVISNSTTNQRLFDYNELIGRINSEQNTLSYKYQLPFTRTNLDEAISTSKAFFIHDFEREIFNKIITVDYWDNLVHMELDEYETLGDAIYFFSTLLKYLDECDEYGCKEQKQILDKLEIVNLERLHINKTNVHNFVNLLERYLQYKYYSKLHDDKDYLEPLRDNVRNSLDFFLEHNQSTKWLLGWADAKTNGIDIETFWPLYHVSNNTDITGAFTKDGYTLIAKMFEVLPSNHTKIDMKKMKNIFSDYYYGNYIQKWVDFSSSFYRASISSPVNEKLSILPLMFDVNKNPFFNVQKLTYEQLDFIRKQKDIDLSKMKLSQLAIENYKNSTGDKLGKVASFIDKNGQRINSIIQKIDSKYDADYLDKVDTVTKSVQQFFETGRDTLSVYNNNRTIKKSVEKKLQGEMVSGDKSFEMKKITDALKDNLDIDQTVDYNLLQPSGFIPFDSTIQFIDHLAADMVGCALQESWLSRVYMKFMNSNELSNTPLFGENGLITKYMNEELGPFIIQDEFGYHPSPEFPNLELTQNFLNYLSTGDVRSSALNLKTAKLTITSEPIEVNEESRIYPNGVILTLTCQSDNKVLENYNFASSLTFDWKPDDCTGVRIEVLYDGFTLVKEYDDEYAFANFINQFSRNGSVKFSSGEFPEQRQMLAARGIEWIGLSYKFKNVEKIRDYYNAAQNPQGIPYQVAECNKQ